MGYPKYNPDYDKMGARSKLISKKISVLKKEGKTLKQSIAIALDMYPKTKRLPLAWKTVTN